jgi:hypothetical protein
MGTKTLAWISLGTAAALCAGCGRVPPTPEGTAGASRPAADKEVVAETIKFLPKPAPLPRLGRVEAAIRNVRERDLLTTNGFWTVFHGILGLGPATTLLNPETGQKINALDFIRNGGEVRGLQFIPTKWGLDVKLGPQMVGQGHQDQFIAEMAQWGMPADRPFVVFGKDYTFMDFVRHAQMRARVTENQELSWAVIIVAQYLGTNAAWTNGYGEKLHLEDLVRYELDASVEEAACGGTHRLFGLSWAGHLHLREGGKAKGVWKEVADKAAKYRDLAKKYQNSDGTFSTNFFRGPGSAVDKQLRINTTGHTLEWLALALSDAELKEQWVEDAAGALSLIILDLQDQPIDGGSLYHAVHGLLIYYARVQDPGVLGIPPSVIPLPPGSSWGKG